MMFGLYVDYPPCFVSSKFDFASLLSVREKRGRRNCLATPTVRRSRNLNQWFFSSPDEDYGRGHPGHGQHEAMKLTAWDMAKMQSQSDHVQVDRKS